MRYDFYAAEYQLSLYLSDAACNSRFSPGSVETGAPSLIEWITCCGNYKHWAGIYIRHPVEKCAVLMALSERWSNKISFVYKTYFIKVSALLRSDSLKAISSILKQSWKSQVWLFQNILTCKVAVLLRLTFPEWNLLPLNAIFALMENHADTSESLQFMKAF